jgi:hypothetical protein
MTPIDIAGKSNSPEVAREILNYFTVRFKFVEFVFDETISIVNLQQLDKIAMEV